MPVFGDRLAALVDGHLGEPDRSRVVAHLTRCHECLAEYDAQLTLKGLLRGLNAPSAPVELHERLSELLATEPVAAVAGTRPGPSRRARARCQAAPRSTPLIFSEAMCTGSVLNRPGSCRTGAATGSIRSLNTRTIRASQRTQTPRARYSGGTE